MHNGCVGGIIGQPTAIAVSYLDDQCPIFPLGLLADVAHNALLIVVFLIVVLQKHAT
jgi:hypothetical protein